MPMQRKPASCHGCSLEHISLGYAPGIGPWYSPLLFLGESLGREEVFSGEVFRGSAGGMLTRILSFNQLDRSLQHIENLVRCQPPGNKLADTSYGTSALDHCRTAYLQPALEHWLATPTPGQNKVVVALGGQPLRQMLGLGEADRIHVQDFHGTVHRDLTDRFWVVPTFHPSFLQRGAFNLLGTVVNDIETAKDVVHNGNPPDPAELVLDPPADWFSSWVEAHIEAVKLQPETVWLAVDIETPEKTRKSDEGELTHKDRDFHIIRVNVANHPDQGITVPFEGPYIPLLKKLLNSPGTKVFHNAAYDLPRLTFNDVHVTHPILDSMWMWHHLQSDVPRGLGFVAPFYSRYGAWKHLSSTSPVEYAAVDSIQTLRIAFGIAEDLKTKGQWEYYWRHVYMLDSYALHPSEEVGLEVDKEALAAADGHLDTIRFELDDQIQALVPDHLRPLDPKQGLVAPPKEEQVDERGRPFPVISKEEPHQVKWCSGCDSIVKSAKHTSIPGSDPKVPCPAPSVQLADKIVRRWFRVKPFNLAHDHMMAYMAWKKHKPGKDKKTKKPTANKDTIRRLYRTTHDPLYGLAIRKRQVDKISSTYVKGTVKRLATNPRSMKTGRLHPVTGHKPSTHRLSQQDPNLQNVVARGDDAELASIFRRCLVARPDCVLLEPDFSGIEAVQTGWFARDPSYIRLAKLGVHAYLASHLLQRDKKIPHAADLHWSDADLMALFKEIKTRFPGYYDLAKRCVHGSNYAMTPRGMHMQFPELFPTDRAAAFAQGLYFEIAPSFPLWQLSVKERAAKSGYLGGKDHPFRYMHWFFNVVNYRPAKGIVRGQSVKRNGMTFQMSWGEDSKRACAFYPQSTAAGVIKEAMLRLFVPGTENYIGDVFFGKTPLRAQIHDSLLLEVPKVRLDEVFSKVCTEMMRPIKQQPMDPAWGMGDYLTIGVEAKVGQNWAPYSEGNLEGMRKLPVPASISPESLAADIVVPMDIYDDELDPDEIAEYLGLEVVEA